MQKCSPVTLDDIYRAYEDCSRKKRNKSGTKAFAQHALYNCMKLTNEINSRTYKLRPSECFIVKYPKPREVFCAAFRDRVVQHFVYNELNPIIEKLLINDTCSCRVGKGTNYAIKRDIRKTRQESENYKKSVWILKADLSGFFMSLNRQWLCDLIMDVVENHYFGNYKDTLKYLVPIIITSDFTKNVKRLVPLSEWNKIPKHKSLFNSTTGLPIGNITSQLFANYALNKVDHYIKSRHRSYVRYVDDLKIIDKSKERLLETLTGIEKILESQGMKLNRKKTFLQRYEYGVSFLGIVVKPHYAVLGKQRINRIYKGAHDFKSAEDAWKSASTRKGMFVRYKGRKIARRWLDSFSPEIKKDITIDDNCNFNFKNRPLRRNKLMKMEVDMDYKVIKSDGTQLVVSSPNFIKMNPRYPSFICCGRDDAECVILHENEEEVCYNISSPKYPEYDTVDVRAV